MFRGQFPGLLSRAFEGTGTFPPNASSAEKISAVAAVKPPSGVGFRV